MPFSVSSITLMELLQGAKNKADQRIIYHDLNVWNVEIIHINENISKVAAQYIKDYSLGKGLAITDALIAATVRERSETLFTSNEKRFQFIPGLKIKVFRP
jgi:predicted nucleic acid-binding protein